MPGLQLPWEAAAPDALAAPRGLRWTLSAFDEPVEGTGPGTVAPRPAPAARREALLRAPAVPASEHEEREMRLRQWEVIAKAAGPHCRLNRDAERLDPAAAAELLRNVFADKATSTLAKRGCSMALFLRWAGQALGGVQAAFPLTEQVVYDYVEYLRKDGAPATRARSFVEAVWFSSGTVGIEVEATIGSARVQGAVARSWATKRLTVKARPLAVRHVRMLEILAKSGSPPRVRVEAGFLCELVHARGRALDIARITAEPYLDVVDGKGFIEVVAAKSKTTRGLKRARLGLPVVAVAEGITGTEGGTWAAGWLRAREELGLRAGPGQVLMPTAAESGYLVADVPASAPQVSAMLRRLLSQAGVPGEELGDYSSHSCKATVLSWLAKAGYSMKSRRLLGGHIKPGERVPIEYSRDALAGPLREVVQLFEQINSGAFDPDATRANTEDDAATGSGPHRENPAFGQDDCETREGESDGADSDTDAFDDDVAEDHEARAACEIIMHDMPRQFDTLDIPAGFDVYFNPRSYVRHLLPLSEPAPGGRDCPRSFLGQRKTLLAVTKDVAVSKATGSPRKTRLRWPIRERPAKDAAAAAGKVPEGATGSLRKTQLQQPLPEDDRGNV
ncbi:unnamed protein product [Prorocentrum cordatum]|uniref:Uncharacterized protein n=1 Tax=Prorocentrum cordatum TaxID=2364126 RepID=A0ABN9XHQ5_9DINO|nr:unnamed protein product [Polarella glacialis]